MSLTNKVAQFDADSDLINQWVHGGITSSITVDSGTVRSPAKLINDKNIEINNGATSVLAKSTTQANISTTKAELATIAKDNAESAKVAAELARDIALIQAGVYTTEALGRAAVADGVAFKVQGSGEIAAYEYRRISSSTSTLIATYPSIEALVATQTLANNTVISLVQTASSCIQTQEIIARFHAFN